MFQDHCVRVKLTGCDVLMIDKFKKITACECGPQIGIDVFAHVWTQAQWGDVSLVQAGWGVERALPSYLNMCKFSSSKRMASASFPRLFLSPLSQLALWVLPVSRVQLSVHIPKPFKNCWSISACSAPTFSPPLQILSQSRNGLEAPSDQSLSLLEIQASFPSNKGLS